MDKSEEFRDQTINYLEKVIELYRKANELRIKEVDLALNSEGYEKREHWYIIGKLSEWMEMVYGDAHSLIEKSGQFRVMTFKESQELLDSMREYPESDPRSQARKSVGL